MFDYVIRNKAVMPRTALRYTIELVPKEMKAEAMRWGVTGYLHRLLPPLAPVDERPDPGDLPGSEGLRVAAE